MMSRNIGSIFNQSRVQEILRDISRFEDKHLFRRRQVSALSSPRLVFMSDEQLEQAKRDAYEQVKARIQMPPVMPANKQEPEVLAKDSDLVGYTKFRTVFVDISSGFSDRTRLMSVREVDGTLREPNFEERTRMNHIYYPGESRSIDVPKLFDDQHLYKVLARRDYEYVLNRACLEFEPDDPRYVEVTSKVYEYIDKRSDYHKLRSTRHFGPMCLHLAFIKRTDGLISDMKSRGLVEDIPKLEEIQEICHNDE